DLEAGHSEGDGGHEGLPTSREAQAARRLAGRGICKPLVRGAGMMLALRCSACNLSLWSRAAARYEPDFRVRRIGDENRAGDAAVEVTRASRYPREYRTTAGDAAFCGVPFV